MAQEMGITAKALTRWVGRCEDDRVALRGEVAMEEALTQLQELTTREKEVLARVADGRTSREIAEEFGISPRTVETHRESLMRKLEIRTVAGLTRFAIESGLVEE